TGAGYSRTTNATARTVTTTAGLVLVDLDRSPAHLRESASQHDVYRRKYRQMLPFCSFWFRPREACLSVIEYYPKVREEMWSQNKAGRPLSTAGTARLVTLLLSWRRPWNWSASRHSATQKHTPRGGCWN